MTPRSLVIVAEGDTVALGHPIGLAGHTGRITGPHLHVSIQVPGDMVDRPRSSSSSSPRR